MPWPDNDANPEPVTIGSPQDRPTGNVAPSLPEARVESDPVPSAEDPDQLGIEPPRAALGRATLVITVCNLISRMTGFIRVIAVAGALGIGFLGDTYQRANEVSNVLFELLIGGLLFSILVPSFVELLSGPQNRSRSTAEADRVTGAAAARELGSVLATRGALIVGCVALVGMFAGTPIMRLLTIGVPASVRAQQIQVGAFLLWFIMPQLVFYAAGAVASALLQAEHRFLATSIAPLFNNVVVTVTMVIFAAGHDARSGLSLTSGEKVLLGVGTLGGTVAMTVVPFVALRLAGLGLRPRWRNRGASLSGLVRRGAWAAGHVGLNEILILVTIVLAGRVDGGVIAYQTAFMFFLLPHALIAYPVFTALFPRLSRRAQADDHDGFAADLGLGFRSMLLLLVPASGLMAAVAPPALSILRVGQLDSQGARMVALVLAGYLVGLCAYSLFFLLTRASYAIGDAKSPTVVNFVATGVAVVAMVAATRVVHGITLLMTFGVIQAVTLIAAVAMLFRIVMRWIGTPVQIGDIAWRAVLGCAMGTVAASVTANLIGWDDRTSALISMIVATLVGCAVIVLTLWVARTPELTELYANLRRRIRSRRELGTSR